MQIPPRLYTLDELKLNGIDASKVLSPDDRTLGSIERYLQAAAVLGGISAWAVFGLTQEQTLFAVIGLFYFATLDSVSCSVILLLNCLLVRDCSFFLYD